MEESRWYRCFNEEYWSRAPFDSLDIHSIPLRRNRELDLTGFRAFQPLSGTFQCSMSYLRSWRPIRNRGGYDFRD